MKFLSKEKNALSILEQIAKSEDTAFPLRAVEGMSLSYAEQIVAKLKKAGFVKSMRGPGGGYVIARHPADIFIYDVIHAIRGDDEQRTERAGTDAAFSVILAYALEKTKQITLADVMRGTMG